MKNWHAGVKILQKKKLTVNQNTYWQFGILFEKRLVGTRSRWRFGTYENAKKTNRNKKETSVQKRFAENCAISWQIIYVMKMLCGIFYILGLDWQRK